MGGASRNMYEGHMDKAKGGDFEGGRQGWVGCRGHGGAKINTNILEEQIKK